VRSGQFNNFIVMADGNTRSAEHDRSRTILLGRQLDGALDLGFFQTTTLDHKVQVYFGEPLFFFGFARLI
ncbi:hypothetical protein NE645_19050, partial [Roseburia hominis]|nr:hypothetical protein [Roseburia hominis]